MKDPSVRMNHNTLFSVSAVGASAGHRFQRIC